MTLQTLKYVIEIARYHSLSQASKALYMSQSALSTAVKELEQELGICIFMRNNRGVSLTSEGEDFLQYARDIVDRSNLLALRYKDRVMGQTSFSVSAQHLPFAVRAFQELTGQLAEQQYDIAIRETSTSSVIYDVSAQRSELGVLAIPSEHLSLLNKSIHAYHLTFTQMGTMKTYVFLRKHHPLARKKLLSMEDLKDYPFVTYDQEDAPGYHTEEALLLEPLPRTIHVCDRASKMLLIRNSDAFSIGVDLPNYNQDLAFSDKETELIAVPLETCSLPIIAGYVHHSDYPVSELGKCYLTILERHAGMLQVPGSSRLESRE